MSEDNEKDDIPKEEQDAIRAYLVFSNGDGLKVYEDLLYTFRDFKLEPEELQDIPHPYREYVKAGCRLVMDKITDMNKIAEELK